MIKYFFYTTLFFVYGCQLNSQYKNENKKYKINKTDSEWKAQLPKMSYHVLRKAGTERAFSGSLNFNKREGVYVCAGCQIPLYESKYKIYEPLT